MARHVEYRPLDSLQPNPENAKLHETVGIAQSMTRFGMVDVITLDDRTGFIVSGHGRVETLRQIRDQNGLAPEGVQVRAGGEWWVPAVVGWASKDDDEAAAATVALNRWVERGGWDTARLLEQLDRMAEIGPEALFGVGFDQPDIDDLLAQQQENTMRMDEQDDDDWQLGDPDRQVRAIMLDLPLDDYRWAAGVCVRARDAYGVDSNAALFLAMLEEDTAR